MEGEFYLIDFEESHIRVSLVSLVLCFAHTPAGLKHQAGIRFAKVYFKWGCAAIEGLKPIALCCRSEWQVFYE